MNLDVLIEGRLAGSLDLPESGWPLLRYDDDYIQQSSPTPLSTLFAPDGRAVHSGRPLENWLLGLLPDDGRVIDSLRDRHNLSDSRPLALLSTPVGRDCAGAVQFCPPALTGELIEGRGGLHRLSGTEFLECLDELRRDPAYRPEGHDPAGGFSLAGMQPKIALRRTASGWALPWGTEPTSHIIKITRQEPYPHEALMEHVTMDTARRLGLRAPRTRVIREGDTEAIVVARYDRRTVAGRMLRIHQEDLCQASGLHPDNKYQRDGGPSPADAAALLRRTVGPSGRSDEAVEHLRDMLILQWLVVHDDAHSKNFSILLAGDNRVLAPLYDACTWLPYRRRTAVPKLRTAMKIGRDYRISSADRPEALIRLAGALRLDEHATARRCEELAAGLPEALNQTVAALDTEDQTRPVVANYVIDQDRRSRRCEQIASAAARQTAPRRGAVSGSPADTSNVPAPALPQPTSCQEPCPTKSGKPCGKPIGPSGHCGVPTHDRRRN